MPRHILVVEPKAAVGETIAAMLESAGYRVTAVTGGVRMREMLDQSKVMASFSMRPCRASTAIPWRITPRNWRCRWS